MQDKLMRGRAMDNRPRQDEQRGCLKFATALPKNRRTRSANLVWARAGRCVGSYFLGGWDSPHSPADLSAWPWFWILLTGPRHSAGRNGPRPHLPHGHTVLSAWSI